MYCILIFYEICFLKFIWDAMKFEIVKSGMVKLNRRENADVVVS
jgi:hypothetical protein